MSTPENPWQRARQNRAQQGDKPSSPKRPSVGGERRQPSPERAQTRDDSQRYRGQSPASTTSEASIAAGGGSKAPGRGEEQRLYGLNACLAVARVRRDDIRKLWFAAERRDAISTLLSWCAREKIGYREVDSSELERISGTRHHEGLCMQVLPRAQPGLDELLSGLPRGPVQLLLAAGIGNPHNIGAMLRAAANFGARALLHKRDDGLGLSAATCRVAEGGAELLPLVAFDTWQELQTALRAHGISLLATTPHRAQSLYATRLPERVVWLLGAEADGLSEQELDRADLRLSIPGAGGIESLNVAAATAVLLGEHWRQHSV